MNQNQAHLRHFSTKLNITFYRGTVWSKNTSISIPYKFVMYFCIIGHIFFSSVDVFLSHFFDSNYFQKYFKVHPKHLLCHNNFLHYYTFVHLFTFIFSSKTIGILYSSLFVTFIFFQTQFFPTISYFFHNLTDVTYM